MEMLFILFVIGFGLCQLSGIALGIALTVLFVMGVLAIIGCIL